MRLEWFNVDKDYMSYKIIRNIGENKEIINKALGELTGFTEDEWTIGYVK